MTKKELQTRLEAGEILVQGIYHGGAAKEQMVRDSKTGGRRSSVVVRQTVLTQSDVIAISEWLPDGSTVAAWKKPVDSGKPCVIIIEQMEMANGTRTVTRGVIEPLHA